MRNKKKLKAKNTNTTRFYNYLCGYFDQRFCFLHLASSCHLVSLCFNLKDPPQHFQQGRSVCCAELSHFSCVRLCDTMDCSPQSLLSMGFSRQEILEWVAVPSSRGSSRPRDARASLMSNLKWQGVVLYHQRHLQCYLYISCCTLYPQALCIL